MNKTALSWFIIFILICSTYYILRRLVCYQLFTLFTEAALLFLIQIYENDHIFTSPKIKIIFTKEKGTVKRQHQVYRKKVSHQGRIFSIKHTVSSSGMVCFYFSNQKLYRVQNVVYFVCCIHEDASAGYNKQKQKTHRNVKTGRVYVGSMSVLQQQQKFVFEYILV